MNTQLWREVNKPCQMHPSYEQGGNVTEASTIVGKCREDGVFIGALCSTQFGPPLAFSFPLASKRDAKDAWHWHACLPQTSRAEGPALHQQGTTVPRSLTYSFLQLHLLHGYCTSITEKWGRSIGLRCVSLTKLLRMVRPLDISDVTG